MHEAWQLTFLILAAFTYRPLSAPEYVHPWDKWLMSCLSLPLLFSLSSGGCGWSWSSHQHSHWNWVCHYRVELGQSASQEKKITAFKITRSFPGHCPICQGGFVICLQRALENLVFLSRSNIRGFPVLFLGFLRQVLLLSPGFLLPQYSEHRGCRCAPLCLACSFY